LLYANMQITTLLSILIRVGMKQLVMKMNLIV
jgi:hypothetical protein